MSSDAWVVAGLGNPGKNYASTPHNVGYMVLDVLAERMGGTFSRHARANAEVLSGRLVEHRVVLARSRDYMNTSGGPIKGVLDYDKVTPDHLIVIHDELDLPLGTIKTKLGGGDNGHNGLKSIRQSLGTGDYYRVRLGIGRGAGSTDPATHVLKPFAGKERTEVELTVQLAADVVESLISDGLDVTQNRFHGS